MFDLEPNTQRIVRAEIVEADIPNVAIGQEVEIQPESDPDKTYVGKVLRRAAVFGARKLASDDPSQRSDERVVEVVRVLVKFMKPGQKAGLKRDKPTAPVAGGMTKKKAWRSSRARAAGLAASTPWNWPGGVAKVVVNDLGGSVDGSGGSSEAAQKVVEEIKAFGGEAIANGSSVTDDAGVAHMVKQAMDAWGRIDILIANAGILRDKTLTKMELADFELVMQVHVFGTFKPIKAVWDIMKAQNHGRIVVTTSSSGMYGNFGQSNYGAAKMAVLGLMNTLKLEGRQE
ncbi:3-oxoacyl-ACP reductase [Aphelenchoides fujianensis]|nr:3-oxoacyl-ACP reductase [Aphelenchoides fujianensis]